MLRLFVFFFLDVGSPAFKKANLISMSKAMTENDKNISTKIVASNFENEIGSEEVSGEKVWRQFGYFVARKSDYSMEKLTFQRIVCST